MKKLVFVSCLLLMSSVAVPAVAQDPLQVAPKMYNLLFENERVRVMEVTFKPEEKIPQHSHPDHFVVVLKPGKLKISKPDGSATEADLKTDQVMWIDAETHWAQNIGKSDVKLLVTELK
jgi:beta-alanine degradation protein BauB